MEENKYRVIKISKQAIFEFIYEKFIEEQECYLEVNPIEVSDTFDINFDTGEFIFIAHNSEDAEGNIIPFPKEIDVKQLMANVPDTTNTMFSDGRYKEYTLEQLLAIQTEKFN